MFSRIQLPTEFGHKIAIVNQGVEISYSQLESLVSKREEILKVNGITPGAHVALKFKDPFSLLVNYIALWNLGATVAVLDSQLSRLKAQAILLDTDISYVASDTYAEIENFEQLSDIDGSTILFKSGFEVRPNVQTSPRNYKNGFVILFTSGSEGTPKAVVLKKSAILNNAAKVRKYTAITSNDSTVISLPLSYSYAMSHTLCHLLAGGRIIFETGGYLVDKVLELIHTHKVSNYAATPYFFRELVDKMEYPNSTVRTFLPSVRFFMNAGGYLSPDCIKALVSMIPNLKFFNNYGQTEASPRLSYAAFDANSELFEGVGKPIEGVKFRVDSKSPLEVGEVYYTSEDFMVGYYNTAMPNLKAEWFGTGDMGMIRDGQLLLSGRKDSMIKVNGRKVFKNHLEDEFSKIEGVKHIKFCKKSHDLYGEYLEATVSTSHPSVCQDELKRKIKQLAKEQLSPSEQPRRINFLSDPHVNSNGKLVV